VMKYSVKLWHAPGLSCMHSVTKDKTVTLEDGSTVQTVLEISNHGVIHLIDDSGTEIYYNGTYFISSKEGHYGY